MEDWILNHGETAQVFLFFGLIGLLSVIELTIPFRTVEGDCSRRWKANWGLTAINFLMLPLLPVSFVGAAIWAQAHSIGLFNHVALGSVATLVLGLLMRGFISFGTHYLMHKVPAMWSIHRIHHLDTEMDVSTTVRMHPLEMWIALVPGLAMVVAFGLSPWVLMVYELLDVTVTLFSHANLSIPSWMNRWLQYLVVTPNLHRIHHSSWQPETDSNFSAVFPIWDVLFGTFRGDALEPQHSMDLGLEDVRDERVSSLRWLLVAPFRSESDVAERSDATAREAI